MTHSTHKRTKGAAVTHAGLHVEPTIGRFVVAVFLMLCIVAVVHLAFGC